MKLSITAKDQLMSVNSGQLPDIGELVVAYRVFTPFFACLLEANGEKEWFEVTFSRTNGEATINYRLIEEDEPAVFNWARIPNVVEAL